MKLACAALLLSCLPAFGEAVDSPPPPEFVADQKADRMYHWYLDGMMQSPDYRGQNLTFRISNDIFAGGDGQVPEFYLTALLHVNWVEIRYPERTSIYSALRRYFLENPAVTLDQLRFSPATINKRITFEQCPELGSAIGTSCWGIGIDRFCDDVFASVTPRVPILVRRGDRIYFDIPERGRLESMDFAIARVTNKDIRKREEDKEFKDIIIWEKELRERPMSETQRDSVVIEKTPGQYILILHGAWADYGDAVHGFYLTVQ